MVFPVISGIDANDRRRHISVILYMDRLEDLLMKRKWKQSCQQDEEPELYDAIKDVAPEWWDEDTRILLHRNNTLKRHKDRNDNEHSWILWLGHYSGGALNFDDGKRIRGQQEWQKINGQTPLVTLTKGPNIPSCF